MLSGLKAPRQTAATHLELYLNCRALRQVEQGEIALTESFTGVQFTKEATA
jgi:hypothetical protein